MRSVYRLPLVLVWGLLSFAIVAPCHATPFVEVEPNNSFAQAQLLSPQDGMIELFGIYNGPNQSGFIDDDFFRFFASSGDTMLATVTPNPPSINMSMFLYDPNTVFTGIAVFGNQPGFTFPVSSTGFYYLTVAGLTPFASGPYDLRITGLSPVPEPSTIPLVVAAFGILAARRLRRR
jgi:PEP-CTERM motif